MEHVNGWCFRGIYKGGLWENDLHVSAQMAFWHDESWSFYLHDIYTTSHCRDSWSRLASSSRNLPFFNTRGRPESRARHVEQVGFKLYRTRIKICLSYRQQAGIQGTKCLNVTIAVAMVNNPLRVISFHNKIGPCQNRPMTISAHTISAHNFNIDILFVYCYCMAYY